MSDAWAHQARAIQGTRDAYRAGARRILVVLPTGGGKTRVGAHYVRAYAGRGERVLWVAHREELVAQAAETLRAQGVEDVGVLAADRDPGDARVVVASVQTLAVRDTLPAAALVVLDEAHHYVAATWGTVARSYPEALTIGLTATPQRGDGTALGDLFEALVVGATVAELQRARVLCPVDVIAPPRALDGLAMPVVEAVTRYGAGRPTVVYAATVEDAREIAEALGPRAAVIDGSMRPVDRAGTLAAWEAGVLDVLVNVYVLTEGWDSPRLNACDCTIVVARGCGSWAMWRQIVGRGLRVAAGVSKRCTVVDLRGAVHAHGLPDEDVALSLDGDAVRRRPEAAEAVARCPACWWVGAPPPGRVCPSCGATIPTVVQRQRLTPEVLERIAATATAESKARYYVQLRDTARARGYRPGWVAARFRAKYGHDVTAAVRQAAAR